MRKFDLKMINDSGPLQYVKYGLHTDKEMIKIKKILT